MVAFALQNIEGRVSDLASLSVVAHFRARPVQSFSKHLIVRVDFLCCARSVELWSIPIIAIISSLFLRSIE